MLETTNSVPRCIAVAALALALSPAMAQATRPASAGVATATAPTLTEALSGEFALQDGRLKDAGRHYLAAARASGDATLAERATRIALLADDTPTAQAALAMWHAADPAALPVRMASLSLDLRSGNVARSAATARGLIRDADPRGWRYALMGLASGGKDPAPAVGVLRQLMEANQLPDDLDGRLAFAGLARRLGQSALTEQFVQGAVQRFPNEPRVMLLHVEQLRDDGDLAKAQALLARLESRIASQPGLRNAVASEYESMGDPAAAARVLAMGEQDDATLGLRAAMLATAKDNAALAKLYDQLKQGASRPDSRRRMLLGTIAETLERYPEALQWYRSLPGDQSRDAARLRIANVLHVTGRHDEAYAELAALQTDPRIDDDLRRDAFLLDAELRHKDKADSRELDAYNRGLAGLPAEPAILYARALAWERMDRIDKAEADLRAVLAVDPDNVAALNALGYTLADRTKRYAEALQLIDRARAADPANPAIVDSYGWVLYRLGRAADALPLLQRAYRQQKDPEIATHVGEVLWVLGRRDEARRFFDEARKLDPGSHALQRTLQSLGVTTP